MAYGVGIEGDFFLFSIDDPPRTGFPRRTLQLRVRRVRSFEPDPGSAVRPCTAQGRTVHIVQHDDFVAVQVESLLSFKLWLASGRIECSAVASISDAHVRYWVLQQILPLVLLLDGSTEFLHGMAVSDRPKAMGGVCIAFLGQSYSGKSTLLQHFMQQHHALVTDDHVALSRRNYTTVLPSAPFYRAYRAAEDLGTRAPLYCNAPSELRRLYLLEPGAATAPIRLERLAGMDAIAALFPNIHYSLHNPKVPGFFPMVEDRFRGLADIVRRVPFARLHVPRSLDRLSEVYDFIQNDQNS